MCAVLCTPGAFPLLLLLLLAAAFLPSDRCCCCCPAVTPAAAVALPPPVPLGKKTQRFRELLQNTLRHTFEQCTQHSSSTSQTGTEGVIKTQICIDRETHMCNQLNPLVSSRISFALNVLKATSRIIYDKARKHPDFLLFKEIIEMLTFLKFHSVNF